MSSGTRKNTKKKSWAIALLLICLLLAAVGGTIAWLTARDSLVNEFTVGDFNEPTTDPDTEEPLPPEDGEKLQGHLYEKNWDPDNAKLLPGGNVAKDPNVGIGDGSEDAYVYLYVKNPAENGALYFKLNDNWKAVDGFVTVKEGVETGDPGYEDGADYYIEGLFVYVGPSGGDTAARLSTGNTGKDAWTGTLFDEVWVDEGAKKTDLTDETGKVYDMEVTALLHQASDGEGGNLAADADTWAKDQAGKLAGGVDGVGSDEGL